MTIRTFWTIFIRILGIWLVLEGISVIPQFFSALTLTYSSDSRQSFALTVALLLLTIGIYIFLLRLLVFKTNWLIDKLRLDQGFDEQKIDLSIQLSTVLKIATIVIGGLLFVDGFPELCRQLFVFFQQKNRLIESPTSGWIIFNLVKTALGYLLMTNSSQVVGFIQKQTAEQNVNSK